MPEGNFTNCPFPPLYSGRSDRPRGSLPPGHRDQGGRNAMPPSKNPASKETPRTINRPWPAWPGSRRARYPRPLNGPRCPVAQHQSRAFSRAAGQLGYQPNALGARGLLGRPPPFTVGLITTGQLRPVSASRSCRARRTRSGPGRIRGAPVRQGRDDQIREQHYLRTLPRTPGRRHHRDRPAARTPGSRSGKRHPRSHRRLPR